MSRLNHAVLIFIALLVMAPAGGCAGGRDFWKQADEGFHYAFLKSPVKSETGDSKITVVRFAPDKFEFALLTARETGEADMTVSEWAAKYNLLAATNAGMYREDGRTSVGYMKNFAHVNNPHLARSHKTVFAFNPVAGARPAAQIIDLKCQDFASLKRGYNSFFQSIRMIDCNRKNVWAKQDDRWSIAALAQDKAGNILFVFSESPYTAHDFGNILLSLPIGVQRAMYLEGGQPAALYFKAGKKSWVKSGFFDSSLFGNGSSMPLPNVIGVRKKGAGVKR